METYTENATFICGHRKSGTTLLLGLLDNHPDLVVYPADSAFFYGYYPAFESPAFTDHQKIERMAIFVANKLEIELYSLSETDRKELNFPLNAMRHDIKVYANATEKSSRDMLISLIRAYHKHFKGASNPLRWVEKTTSSEIYAAKILEWFPQAKFIHVIRDPRDNWGSLKAGWSKLYYKLNDSLELLMHQMIERCRLGMEFSQYSRKRFGSEVYKIIKFEDLTTNPEKILKEICNFLKIRFSENMLIPTVCGKLWRGNNFSGLKFEEPSTANIGRWQERITEDEARLIEYHFGSLMEYFGYKTVYPLKERIDAATMHYTAFNARNLMMQLCPDILEAGSTSEIPDWRKDTNILNSDFQDGTYVFNVSLGNIRRRLVVAGKTVLEQLGNSILDAFGFDNYHISCFIYKDRSGNPVNVHHPEMNIGPPPWIDEIYIGELPLSTGSSIKFIYDFSANWEFDVKLEQIEPADTEIKKPVITEVYGKAPQQYPDWNENG